METILELFVWIAERILWAIGGISFVVLCFLVGVLVGGGI